MNKLYKVLFPSFFILFQTISISQIKIHELPLSNQNGINSLFYDVNQYRHVKLLNDGWKIFSPENTHTIITASVPSEFEGDNALTYEKEIYLTKEQIDNYKIILNCLGINYSADVSLNNNTIYKYSGGGLPFSLELPGDILIPNSNNKISISVTNKLSSQTTIPVKQRFLFPVSYGGIIRNVYLQFLPKTNISSAKISYSFGEKFSAVKLHTDLQVNELLTGSSNENAGTFYSLIVNVFSGISGIPVAKTELTFNLTSRTSIDTSADIEIKPPLLWSPDSPNNYTVQVLLLKNGALTDQLKRLISFYKLEKKENLLYLNGAKFILEGTTYYGSHLQNIISSRQLEDDLRLIKQTGFNAVRFAKIAPDPYALQICQEVGLLAFVEVPINSIPEELLGSKEFVMRYKSYLQNLLTISSQYNSVAGIGIGSSFLTDSKITEDFINTTNNNIKSRWSGLTYASFAGLPKNNYSRLDLIGIELYGGNFDSQKNIISSFIENQNASKFFISEATYPNFNGSTNGYLNAYSYEAEAKYFSDLIDYSRSSRLGGFILNSIFNYAGSFCSLFTGYSPRNEYKVGILDDNRNLNSITYRAVNSKLLNKGKITIPIGSPKDDSPISFILIALGLSVFMALLINSNKRFREDCTRALFRSYNFFADIRDQRIVSGLHAFILMIIISGAFSLLISILLYFEKQNILFEKILLGFGSAKILAAISMLAWNPVKSFIYLSVVLIILLGIVSIAVKIASFFVKTKVSYNSIVFVMVWAFLPLTIFLPVELILYKILVADLFNNYFYIFLALFMLWLIQRLLKGIYIIFDIRPLVVYTYTAVIILAAAAIFALYSQLSNTALYYISNAVKQYNSMIF